MPAQDAPTAGQQLLRRALSVATPRHAAALSALLAVLLCALVWRLSGGGERLQATPDSFAQPRLEGWWQAAHAAYKSEVDREDGDKARPPASQLLVACLLACLYRHVSLFLNLSHAWMHFSLGARCWAVTLGRCAPPRPSGCWLPPPMCVAQPVGARGLRRQAPVLCWPRCC